MRLVDLPEGGAEVAFAGRSNAGKSSALNALTRAGLARVSKTPGRTQAINVFALDEDARLVDLPGYGYAAVAHALKDRWQILLARYLEEREALRGLVLTVDIRRGIGVHDEALLQLWRGRGRPLRVVLTKADTLGRGPAQDAVRQAQSALAAWQPASVQTLSVRSREGVESLQQWVSQTLELADPR